MPFSSDLLAPYFRPVRLPLAIWTETIFERVSQAHPDATGDLYAACDCITSGINEAALVEVYFGRPDHALALCRAALRATASVVTRTNRLAAAQFAFQPYINQGRLDKLQGHWDEALEKFRQLRRFLDGEPIALGPLQVTPDHREAIARDCPAFGERMRANYLVDTVTTLLRAARGEDLLRFAQANEATAAPWATTVLQEATVAAWSCLGAPETALQLTASILRDLRRADRAVFLCRRAELLLSLGDVRASVRICRGLAAEYLKADLPIERTNVRLLVVLARLLIQHRDEFAVPITKLGLQCSEHLNDVLFQQEFLSLIAALSCRAEDKAAIQWRSNSVRRASWYRSPGATPSSEPPEEAAGVIDRLYETVLTRANAL